MEHFNEAKKTNIEIKEKEKEDENEYEKIKEDLKSKE